MNKELILSVADTIEQQPETGYYDKNGFNMGSYTHDCGTPSCMAGWAIALKEERDYVDHLNAFHKACNYFGVSEDDGHKLFLAYNYDDKRTCVQVLRNLAETGNVDWHQARRDAYPEDFA